MDLSDSQLRITRLNRQVMWRKRLIALQRYVAVALLSGGLVSAALVLYTRLRPVEFPAWALAVAVMLAALALALLLWARKWATEREAAFFIDERLELEDRIATSQVLLERGGPGNDFEAALIEDAAGRIEEKKASAVVSLRLSPMHALGVLGIAALAVALLIPERSLPGGEALAAAREDIQSAGEILEQSAAEIEQSVAPESETAGLAKEQAELGRALRVSPETRDEALKKLSALEQRIRRRHDELAGTRADEIVSLAEKRLRAALSPRPTNRKGETSAVEGEQLRAETQSTGDEAATGRDEKRPARSGTRNSDSRAGD
jgi:hypothetical protein